jgi:hypothetical protein
MGCVKDPLEQYLNQATLLVDRLKDTKSQELLHIVDVIRMGRGVMTQQAAEIKHLRNELNIKTETIRMILGNKPKPIVNPKEPA